MACHVQELSGAKGRDVWACRRLRRGLEFGGVMTGHRTSRPICLGGAARNLCAPPPLVARPEATTWPPHCAAGRPTQHLMRIAAHQADSPLLLEAGAEAPGEAGAHGSASASPDIAPSVRRSGASPSASVRGGSCSALSCFEGSG